MRRIFALLPDLAKSQARVLVEGPTGCGKELVARALHNLSPRKRGPFVPINCGAIPDHLFESELFGYARGAFTDAKQDKAGWVAAARGGTLVLDEICDLSLPNQVKLLRLLQEGEYSPLGSTAVAKADIRVVALTNKPLLAAVRAGTFREDLYYRLSVIHVRIPPLRERPDDIPVLLTQMIKRFNQRYGKQVAAVTPNVSAILAGHTFPGNVRELENIIEHAFVVCHGELIDVCHLPMDLQENLRLVGPGKSKLEKAEAQVFAAALMEARGSPKIAAEKLGISRSTFYRHMKRHALSAQAACPFPSDHSG